MKRTALVICAALLASGAAVAAPASAAPDPPRLLASHVQSGGSVPEATAIGDLTGDGLKDLAVANGSGGDETTDDLVFVFPQLGDGVFGSPFPVTPSAPSQAYELAVGHLDGDALPDLAVGIPGVGIDLFFGTGSGNGLPSTPDSTISAAFIHLAVGDLNGDGRDDLIYTRTGAPYSVVLRAQQLLGGFGSESTLATHLQATGLSLGDVDGNPSTDFAIDGPANDTAAVFIQDPLLHTFSRTDVPLPTEVTRSLLADVNDDGMADLVVAEVGGAGIAWAPGAGDGTFGTFTLVGGTGFSAEEVGDLNGDGVDDLAAFTNGKLRVYAGSVAGLTSPCVFPATDVAGNDAATSIGDLTGDGAVDLAAAEGGGQIGAATVFLQLTGSETLPTDLSLTVSSSSVVYGDTITLAGALTNEAGGCMPASSVSIDASLKGGAFDHVKDVPLGADLSYSTEVSPPSAGTVTYRATWTGVGGHADAIATRDVSVAKAPTSLTLGASASVVRFGGAVTLRATLVGSVGSPSVDFYRIVDGVKTKIGSAVADADGVATRTITPSRNAGYQARFAGDAGLSPSASTTREVDVRVVVVGSMVRYARLKGGVAIYDCCKAYYRFLVKPKHPGGIVHVSVQYLAGGRWHKLPSEIDTFQLGPDGTDQIFLHVAGGKGYTFRARSRFASDGDHLGAWSTYVKFRFR